MTDPHLLTAYQQTPSPELFSKLVNTYINLVFSVARRSTNDTHLAQDITQEVFLTLARKAPTLEPSTPLAGWLFTTTRNISMQTLRAASRRGKHESEAAMSHQPPAQPDPLWPLIAEEIDAAVADLPPADSGIILLRYFANHSTAQVATTLAISEDAAKKRLQRALEALEKILTSRGFATTTALTLAATLTTHAVHAAPSTLAASITTKSAALLVTKGTLIATAKLKMIIAAAAVLTIIAIPTTIFLSAGTTPAATPSAVSVPASDPTDQPATPDAPADGTPAYAMPDNRFLIALPTHDSAMRNALYSHIPADSIPRLPDYIAVLWSKQPRLWNTASSDGYPLDVLLPYLIDTYSPEIASPLVLPRIKSDIVFREGGTNEQYLADLQIILSDYFKRPITCTFETRTLPAVVLSGNYDFNPIPDAPLGRDAKPAISLFIKKLDRQEPNPSRRFYVSGALSPRELLGRLSQYIDEPIVSDAQGFPTLLPFCINTDVESHQPLSPQDKTLLLNHFAQQTGLTVTHESRPIRCLVITPVDPRIAAADWQNFPKASPFQAIRWNNDLPEVQYNKTKTWSQLLYVCNVPIEKIIAFAKLSDPKDWQRRFEEDFIALLALMGYSVNDRSFPIITVKNLQTGKTTTQMFGSTQQNRDAIHKALNARETPPTK